MLKRILYMLTLTVLLGQLVNAQVTTSSITGTARDRNGQPLTGATVTATHLPSGTTYSTVAGKDGGFSLPNLRIGGPYEVRVNYVGLEPFSINNITLLLGEPYNINATLG